jgi:hypothetical protein
MHAVINKNMRLQRTAFEQRFKNYEQQFNRHKKKLRMNTTNKINEEAVIKKEESCCRMKISANDKRASRFFAAARSWKGFMPSIILILMPKCPVCFAAYIALITSAGISVTTAAYIRIALIILCITSLLYLATKRLLNLIRTL